MLMLGIYLASCIGSFITLTTIAKASDERLKREGYCEVPSEKSKSEKFLKNLEFYGFMLFFPLNIIIAITGVVKFDEIYRELLIEAEKDGRIVKKQDKEVEIDLKTKEMNRTRKYSELSNEEKLKFLEKEKSRLLCKEENVVKLDKAPYQKKMK